MRFIPQAFFNTGLEPCVTSYATGAVSSSITYGSVNYDVYVFTCSLQAGKSGSGVEYGQLFISEGYTRRAVVVCIGGGGAGSSDGNGGGGGAMAVGTNIYLGTGEPYNIEIGQGADGTDRYPSSGLPFSGDDGSNTTFSRGAEVSIVAVGGQGGTLGGYGGSSGNNHSSGSGGAGAGEGELTSGSGAGYTIFFGEPQPNIRAGGGGQGEDFVGIADGYQFGGGEDATAEATGIDGSGGSIIYNILTAGGGGTGGQYLRASDSHYISSKGGGGAVLVAIPNNLCTSSLYQNPEGIVEDNIISQINVNNAKLFGKDIWGQEILDTYYNTNLIHSSSVTELDRLNYSGSQPNLATSGSEGNDSYATSNNQLWIGNSREPRLDYFSGQSPLSASQDWTIEWIGATPDGGTSSPYPEFDCIKIGDTPFGTAANYFLRLYVRDASNGNIQYQYYDGTSTLSSTVTNASHHNQLRQHALTYNSTSGTVSYYINGTFENSINVTIGSALDNPYLTIGNDTSYNRTTFNDHDVVLKELRIYQKELNSTELLQNYSASFNEVQQFTEISLASGSDISAACTASLSSSYYISSSDTLESGTLLYQDSDLTTIALDAWYKESATTSSFEIVSGSVTNFGTACPPLPISINLASGSDSSSACNEVTTSLYYYADDETFVSGATLYTDTGLSITASNNWYREVPSTSSFEVIDGIRGDDLTCGFECELWRFTAGGSGGNASFTECGGVPITGFALGPGVSVDKCIVSGSYKAITGAGSTLTYLGTC